MSDTPEPRVRLDNLLSGIRSFAQDMRDAGIHVGMGRNPKCVTCGEPWPCSTERAAGVAR